MKSKIAIIGAGPAGLTAAIYLQRANLETIIFDGDAPGGKMVKTAHVENYPGFKKINGADLSYQMYDQALSLGTQHIGEFVKLIKQESNKYKVITKSNIEYIVDAVIIAIGTENRKLNIPGEKEFFNKGVSYCAICDSSFLKTKVISIVGSGNSAVEEALFLSDIGSQIHLFVRGNKLKAEDFIIDLVNKKENINIHFNSRLTKINGNNTVEEIEVYDDLKKENYKMQVSGVFPFIGLDPIKIEVDSKIELKNSSEGFIIVDENLKTNIEGIYAIGDIIDKKYRQISTAINDGTIAALSCKEFLQTNKWK